MLSPTGAFVQRADPERFITTLFAPAPDHLWALYAFNHEIARARAVASEPTLALIRLQWWREVVDGADRRHEVATPLRAAITAGALDPAALHRMIDAREQEAETTVDRDQWHAYLCNGAGVLMAQAGRVLGAAETDTLARLGAGCGAVGLLRNAASLSGGGRWALADGMNTAEARATAAELLGPLRRWDAAALPAALPAVFARRWLQGRSGMTGGRLAVLWSAMTRRV